jgi:hypothetical protein
MKQGASAFPMNADVAMVPVELYGVLPHDRDCKAGVTGQQIALFASTSLPFPRWLYTPAQALLKRSHEANRLMMLLEEVSDGFSGKLLEGAAGLFANRCDRLPSIVVELHALAGHS